MRQRDCFLKSVQMFSGIPDSEVKKLAEEGRKEVIFHAEDAGSCLFILKTGSVKISICDEDGREDILNIVQPYDFFGEMSILDGRHRSTTATALDGCSAFAIERSLIIGLVTGSPQFAMTLLDTLCGKIRQTNEKIASLRFADSYGKVARILLGIYGRKGKDKPIAPRLTRQELADIAGVTRETLTRVLSEFQENGCIRMEGSNIVILNEALLRRNI